MTASTTAPPAIETVELSLLRLQIVERQVMAEVKKEESANDGSHARQQN